MIVRCKDKVNLFIDVPINKLLELGYFVVEPNAEDLNKDKELELSESIMLDIYEYCNK